MSFNNSSNDYEKQLKLKTKNSCLSLPFHQLIGLKQIFGGQRLIPFPSPLEPF